MIGRTRTSQDKMETTQSKNIFDTLSPKLHDYVSEVFKILSGESTKFNHNQKRIILRSEIELISQKTSDIVSTIIDNCKRKKNLGYVVNEVMSKFQYANMAGFNLVNLFGEFRPIYQGNQNKVKEPGIRI